MGELVVVRAPPGRWLVVDGCSVGGRHYGQQLLDHYGVTPDFVILTHPHLDHAKGVAEVIDAATTDPDPKTWPRIGLVWPRDETTPSDLSHLTHYYDSGVAEQAVSAIFDRWERVPSCRLKLDQGDVLPFGEARLKVLSPAPATRTEAVRRWTAKQDFDSNRLSTVLQVEWAGLRILLGSDLVEIPGAGWTDVLAFDAEAPRHAAFKVAHHGSTKAQHPAVLTRMGPDDEPTWVATPYATKRLPGFQPGEGGAVLLGHVPKIHLTGVPRAFQNQGVTPSSYRLSDLQGPAQGLKRDPPVTGFPDCLVALSWKAGGGPPTVHHGKGSLTVERG
ncbi:hypothetical protein LZ199_25285 [Myxococcus sp. QH3KD-4-1]|nr:hypothetical protein [Myxococcus qinghaiensis]